MGDYGDNADIQSQQAIKSVTDCPALYSNPAFRASTVSFFSVWRRMADRLAAQRAAEAAAGRDVRCHASGVEEAAWHMRFTAPVRIDHAGYLAALDDMGMVSLHHTEPFSLLGMWRDIAMHAQPGAPPRSKSSVSYSEQNLGSLANRMSTWCCHQLA